ncbi:MAG: transporter substrate-binding domain-containing protein [Bacteroidia bacterium]|nr:transporter substrate-binding domain-containing protein [Bacteroidia bacterium]
MNTRILTPVLAIVLLVLSGCVGSNMKINSFEAMGGKTIGVVSVGAIPANQAKVVARSINAEPGKIIEYNRRSDAIMAVLSGKADGITCPSFVAEYYAKRNNSLKVVEPSEKIPYKVIMVVRKEDETFRNELNRAIGTLYESGRLQSIENEWITNLPLTGEPANIGQMNSAGARKIRVGISGDFPPLDYISADGRPAGFNVAFLSEIGTQLDIKFEFVSLESAARFTALASGKIDVIFFHFKSEQAPDLFDFNEDKWVMTNPYYEYLGDYFLVKK